MSSKCYLNTNANYRNITFQDMLMKIKRGVLLHSKKLFSSASVLNCLFKGTSTFFLKELPQMGPVLFHLVIKMSKTYCGVVEAYQALEMKIKYLTQNEKFVLLYRK